MEHIKTTVLANGMLHLQPEVGYALYNDITYQFYAEAIVKTEKGFRAVLDGISPEPHERTLDDAKAEKLAALAAFVLADKKFYIGKKAMWVGPNERANLKNAVEALSSQGVESVQYEGMTLPVATALQMISAVEAYAALHSMNEARHRATILAKRAISTVDAYDFTGGFPESIRFNPNEQG